MTNGQYGRCTTLTRSDMVYRLLKDMHQSLSARKPLNDEDQGILERICKVLSTMRNEEDSELLHPYEVLVRICPATKYPVLTSYEGDNMCSCLHNGSVEEDAADVQQWLASNGKVCSGNQRLLEAVADIAYNAGADDLCDGNDSRIVTELIVEWAQEFEQKHVANDWREDDYISAIDEFYREKADNFKQQKS